MRRLCMGEHLLYQVLDVKDQKELHRLELSRMKEDLRPILSRTMSVTELMERARSRNFTFREELENLRASTLRLKNAYGNLFSHANINTLAGVKLYESVWGSLTLFGDLLPFLWPNRWAEVGAKKKKKEAQGKSVEMAQWNGALQTELLALSILRDQKLEVQLRDERDELSDLLRKVKAYQDLGFYRRHTSAPLSAVLTETSLQLDLVVGTRQSGLLELNFASGFADPHTLKGVEDDRPIDVQHFPIRDENEIFQRALSQSLELQQLDFLISASRERKSGRYWNFLDPSGDAAGGLGLGSSSYIELGSSAVARLQRLRDQQVAQLKLQIADLWQLQNRLQKRYQISLDGFQVQDQRLKDLKAYLVSGSTVSLLDLADAYERRTEFLLEMTTTFYDFRIVEARLRRLMLFR